MNKWRYKCKDHIHSNVFQLVVAGENEGDGPETQRLGELNRELTDSRTPSVDENPPSFPPRLEMQSRSVGLIPAHQCLECHVEASGHVRTQNERRGGQMERER